jgi:uridine kinase
MVVKERRVNDASYIIGIAGGTGSGKTTAAKAIVEGLPAGDAVLLQHDWYYKDHTAMGYDERARINFDEPAALDNELLAEHLASLHAGHAIDVPQYDFKHHLRLPDRLRVEPARIVVVEGILLFAVDALREQFDLLLFVDTDDDIRLMRRIKRDILNRGRDIDSIQRQYYDTVRPMHRLHVSPTRAFAHLIIPEGGENRQAVDVIVGRLLHLLETP